MQNPRKIRYTIHFISFHFLIFWQRPLVQRCYICLSILCLFPSFHLLSPLPPLPFPVVQFKRVTNAIEFHGSRLEKLRWNYHISRLVAVKSERGSRNRVDSVVLWSDARATREEVSSLTRALAGQKWSHRVLNRPWKESNNLSTCNPVASSPRTILNIPVVPLNQSFSTGISCTLLSKFNTRITVAGSAVTRLKSYKVSLYDKKWDYITFPIRSQIGDERVSSEEAVIANGQKCISLHCFQYFSSVVFFSFVMLFIFCIL